MLLSDAITGNRAHEIFADDLEASNNSKSIIKRDRMFENVSEFSNVATLMHDMTGRIIYIGTPHANRDSLYERLCDQREASMHVFPKQILSAKQKAGCRNLHKIYNEMELAGAQPGDAVAPYRFGEKSIKQNILEGSEVFCKQILCLFSDVNFDASTLELKNFIVCENDVLDSWRIPISVNWGIIDTPTESNLVDIEMGSGVNGNFYYDTTDHTITRNYISPDNIIAVVDPSGKGDDPAVLGIGCCSLMNKNKFITRMESGGGKDDFHIVDGVKVRRSGYDKSLMREFAHACVDEKVSIVYVEDYGGYDIWLENFKEIMEEVCAKRKVDRIPVVKLDREIGGGKRNTYNQ